MSDNKFSQLQEQIDKELSICEPSETPVVCAAMSNENGREAMQKLVMEKVMTGKLSIRDAIISIDNEFDVNSYAEA